MDLKLSGLVAFSALSFGFVSGAGQKPDVPMEDLLNSITKNTPTSSGIDPSALILCAGMVGTRGRFEDDIEKEKQELAAKISKDLENNLKLIKELNQKQQEFHEYYSKVEQDYTSKTEQITDYLSKGDHDSALSIIKTRISEEDFQALKSNKDKIDQSIEAANRIIEKQKQALKNIDIEAAKLILLDQVTTIHAEILKIAESALHPIESKSMLEYEDALNNLLARAKAEQQYNDLVHADEKGREAVDKAIEDAPIEEKLREIEESLKNTPADSQEKIATPNKTSDFESDLLDPLADLELNIPSLENSESPQDDEQLARQKALEELGISEVTDF
jgi:hypothetical protein